MTHLLAEQFRDFSITMAKRIYCDSRSKVKIAPVLNIPQVATFTLYHHGRWSDVGCNHVRQMIIDNSSGLRVSGRVMIGK